jgi:hypothetical protein
MTDVLLTTMNICAYVRQVIVTVDQSRVFVVKTIVLEIHVQLVQYVWIHTMASNACVLHGNHLALIVKKISNYTLQFIIFY